MTNMFVICMTSLANTTVSSVRSTQNSICTYTAVKNKPNRIYWVILGMQYCNKGTIYIWVGICNCVKHISLFKIISDWLFSIFPIWNLISLISWFSSPIFAIFFVLQNKHYLYLNILGLNSNITSPIKKNKIY